MLTFVSKHEHYSIYLDTDGDEVYIGHGPGMRRLVDFDWDDVRATWDALSYSERRDKGAWLDTIRASVLDPDDVDQIVWCAQCEDPHLEENCHSVESDEVACENCYSYHYSVCSDCDTASTSTNYTLHDERVCEQCTDNRYSWCEDCDGYYHNDYSGEHTHDGSGCCDPVATSFRMRNDGDPILANDTRATVTLPAGTIDAEGIVRIQQHIGEHLGWNAAHLVTELGPQWQTKEGNFTKRLSRHIWKSLTLKVPPAVLSQVGCIARDHSTSVDFQIEITRELNQSAEDFGHEDSCWWQSYFASRCALKSNGGFGLRTFSESTYYPNVTGRAWVMPLKTTIGWNGTETLLPTFDTLDPAAFVVFNGYGDLSGYAAARIISHMSGFTYRKIAFTCTPMYVNGESGYLIAPEEIACRYTDGSLHLDVDQHANLHYSEAAEATAAAAILATATTDRELVNA